MTQSGTEVAVIGAGIVGVCTAYELRKRGLNVVLIDKDQPGSGCSFGNSGALSSGAVVPLAMPGVLASVPSMLGKPDSPLFLPWRYFPKAAPWLARFVWSARPAAVQRSAARLAQLHNKAVERHDALAHEVGVPELILRGGHLHLYADDAAVAADQAGWNLRQQHGMQFHRVNRADILNLEPNIPQRYQTAMFMPDQATVRNPYRYVQAIFKAFLERGGRFVTAQVNGLKPGPDGWSIETTGSTLNFASVVVAAGVWSGKLLKPLGVNLSLETQRGYHVQFKSAESPVSRTVVLTDRKIFVTPMEDGLRVGGTVELAGLKAAPNQQRAEILLDIARETFPDLDNQSYEIWMGHRPCMPDSVPVVQSPQRLPQLWVATGHGHLGLTDSVGTAHEIADGIQGSLARAA